LKDGTYVISKVVDNGIWKSVSTASPFSGRSSRRRRCRRKTVIRNQRDEQPTDTAELRDHRLNPEGVVPKQSQAYVMAGLA